MDEHVTNYWVLTGTTCADRWEQVVRFEGRPCCWEGLRSHTARDLLRAMKPGDLALVARAGEGTTLVLGIVEIVRGVYADPSQFDPQSPGFDPRSTREEPRWECVDVYLRRTFEPPIERAELIARPELHDMLLLRKGDRMPVQPVTPGEWKVVSSVRR